MLYIQILRCHCFKSMSPVVFPFFRIFSISFIDKDNREVIKKTTVILTWKVFKKVLLHTCFFPEVFPIIVFVIIPSKTKVIDSFTYILHFALITREQIYNVFVIAVKAMNNNILFLVNWAREGITLSHIHAYLTTLTITFKWSNRSF